MTFRCAILALSLLLGVRSEAHGDGLDLAGVGAHAVGRAGIGVLSSDDGAALYYNPAGLARQSRLRLGLGLSFAARSALYERSDLDPVESPPTVHDLGDAELVPSLSLEIPLGRRLMVGLAYLTPTAILHAFPAPPTSRYALPEEDHAGAYPERYAGTRSRLFRRGIGVGLAVRALPWLAMGGALLGLEVSFEQDRTLWAGVARDGAEPIPEDPRYDLAFSARGRDHFVPALSLGFVVAPLWAPVELGASVFWAHEANLAGAARLADSRGQIGEKNPEVAAHIGPGASAAATWPSSLAARAGVRSVWPRAAVEINTELRHGADSPSGWRLSDVSVTPDGGVPSSVGEVPLAITLRRDTYALRAALDVDVVPGFLLLTAGYAYSQRVVSRGSLSTTLPDLTGHTLAIGAEARLEGMTLALGISHTEFVAETVAQDDSQLRLVNPLQSGDAAVGGGRYDGSATLVGLSVEVEL